MNDRIGGILGVVILIQMFFIGIAFGNHCILYNPSTETISVICGSASLSDINEQLVDSSILKQESHGIWILNANLTIANGANLYINSTDASWLKINSTTPNTAHNIDIFGDMTIESVKVTSWNTTSNNYTTTDGRVPRASMTIPPEATGKTKIRSSEIAYLGYNSSHSEGLAYYGGTGGILENNIIHHLWYGLYLKEGQNVTLTNNHFYANTADGNLHQVPNRPMVTNHSATRDSTPLLAITSPTFNATIPYNRVLVEGTTFDAGFQVQKVEVVVQTYPLDNPTFNYQLANPVAIGNWSRWSIPMNIASVGPHRILAMVTDTTGNQEWAEVTINVPFIVMPIGPLAVEHPKYRIAFVQPSFTEGAYNVGGFYTFYPKYNSTAAHVNVTTDLSNLTAVVPEELADERYIRPLTQQIKRLAPDATVSNIRDEDVHNGYIFAPDGSNAYDVLFLLHDEYATSSSYYNFKRFVNNGGTIVFLDGNVFYAQVSYNKNMHTVTLLQGHDWQFDGKAAIKSVRERYFNENKEWVGSNFLYGDIAAPVRFDNNPFNYTHFEENYVNNPNATILLDYGAQIPQHVSDVNELRVSAKIATYELNYGKGKVIVMGLYAQNLVENQAFLQFFDHIVLPRALGQPYRYDAAAENESIGYWWMNTGKISKIEVDNQSKALILTLEMTEQKEDNLLITLPRELFTTDDSKTITVNDKKVQYSQTPDDVEIGVEIPLAADATKVQISMTTNNTDLGNKAQAELSQNRSTVSGYESVASNNKSSMIANIEIVEGASSATNDEFYKPGIIDVSKGTTIIWTNNDVEVHTVTSGNLDTGARTGTFFDSGYLSTGNTFQHIFNDPRTFDYYCTLHPFMKGKVIVK